MICALHLNRRAVPLASAILLLLATASRADAQTTCLATTPTGAPSCNLTLNASATVAHLLQLTVNGGAQTTLASPVVTTYDSSAAATGADEYPVGATGPLLTVKANRGWQLTIKAQNPYFAFAKDATFGLCRPGDATGTCTNSSSAPLGKPAAELVWSLNAATAFAGLSTTAATVSSNAAGSSASYTIYFRAKWLYATDVPGTYTLPVVYTVTGQ
jgi:hypothetical protein